MRRSGFAEVVEVDDQDSVGLQIGKIRLQRRGIHGDQGIDAVAGRIDVARRKMDLESADARKRALQGVLVVIMKIKGCTATGDLTCLTGLS